MRLGDLKVERLWLVFVPVGLIILSMISRKVAPASVWVPVTGWLHVLASAVFLLFFWSNRKLPGMKWFLAGWAANIVPIVANAGKMPVSVWAAKVARAPEVEMAMRHLTMSSKTHFNWLADFIPVTRPPLIAPAVLSPGDVLMAVGIFLLIQITMCPRKPTVAGS